MKRQPRLQKKQNIKSKRMTDKRRNTINRIRQKVL